VVRTARNWSGFKHCESIGAAQQISPTLLRCRNHGYQDGLDYLCRALHSLRCDLGKADFLCVVTGMAMLCRKSRNWRTNLRSKKYLVCRLGE